MLCSYASSLPTSATRAACVTFAGFSVSADAVQHRQFAQAVSLNRILKAAEDWENKVSDSLIPSLSKLFDHTLAEDRACCVVPLLKLTFCLFKLGSQRIRQTESRFGLARQVALRSAAQQPSILVVD